MINIVHRRVSTLDPQFGHASNELLVGRCGAFLQGHPDLNAASLRAICHIGHRRQMANLRDKPLV
jgi:hypothetical protein